MDKIKLYNGVEIPQVGLGTWLMNDEQVYQAFFDALSVGYIHFDSAQVYENEEGLGNAIKDSNVKRENIFVTTKISRLVKTYEDAVQSIELSLKKLKIPYIDLLLIHWPAPNSKLQPGEYRYEKENIEVWKAMEEFYKKEIVKAIGVSNFMISDIQNLIDNCEIKPMVNQIPVFIGRTNLELIDYCKKNDIAIEAYSPIGHGKALENDVIISLADKYHCSIANLCLSYVKALNIVSLPKTLNKEHMKSNLNADIQFSEEELNALKQIKLDIRW